MAFRNAVKPPRTALGAALALAAFATARAPAGDAAAAPLVDARTRLAVTGDSITEQKQYSRFIELYATACAKTPPAAVMQFGWGGERAPGFAGRLDYDCLFWKPTLLTTCFGMNDGGYRKFEEGIGHSYRNGLAAIVEKAKAAGATVLVGGPGAVDPAKFKRNNVSADDYNAALAELSKIARAVAEQHDMPFADVHAVCMDAMAKAKAALGEDYVVMGNDGFHPGENGHFAMAYAFLKAMGFDGDIGRITLDMAGDGAATATDGHVATAKGRGVVEVESARWPFCVGGDAKGQTSRALLPYTHFSRDLNRFVLVVANLPSAGAEVAWGTAKRAFTREELAAGVNLADAFAGETPFQNAWTNLNAAVRAKQNYETQWIKQLRAPLRGIVQRAKMDAEVVRATDLLYANTVEKEYPALVDNVKKAFVPVTHTITVTPDQ